MGQIASAGETVGPDPGLPERGPWGSPGPHLRTRGLGAGSAGGIGIGIGIRIGIRIGIGAIGRIGIPEGHI